MAEEPERDIEASDLFDPPETAMSELSPEKGRFGDKHCDRYVKALGRICDKPATVCQGGRYRCDEHDPFGKCPHDRLNEDGICRACGEDRRRG